MAKRVIKNPSGFHSRGSTAQDKADNLGAFIKQHGWTGKWSVDEESGILHLFARRGENETIDVWWLVANGAAHPDMLPIYTLAGERIKCRNVSAIAAIAAKEVDTSRLHKATRKLKKTGEAPIKIERNASFDDMADDEIEKALLGKRITWINSISGAMDEAEVLGRKTIKVYRNGRDQIHFTDYAGFHAVYLDSIVKVK